MKSQIFALVAFCTIASSMAAAGIGPATVHQSNPSECYVSQDDKYYKAGESWQIEGCAIATCNWSNYSGSSQLMLSYESCGVVDADPPCTVTEDLSMHYPDCCPQVTCPEVESVVAKSDEMEDSNESTGSSEVKSEVNSEVNAEKNASEEKDSDNEVEDTISIMADPKTYEHYQGFEVGPDYDNLHGSLNFGFPIEDEFKSDSNDLGAAESAPFRSTDLYDLGFEDRKVSPRFQYIDTNPKFAYYQWI